MFRLNIGLLGRPVAGWNRLLQSVFQNRAFIITRV